MTKPEHLESIGFAEKPAESKYTLTAAEFESQYHGKFDRLAELERAVILAAIGRRLCERHLFPMGAPNSGNTLLDRLFVDEQQAVDALLAVKRNK